MNIKTIFKDFLLKALEDNRESALLLKNWDLLDDLAKSKKADVWKQTMAFLANQGAQEAKLKREAYSKGTPAPKFEQPNTEDAWKKMHANQQMKDEMAAYEEKVKEAKKKGEPITDRFRATHLAPPVPKMGDADIPRMGQTEFTPGRLYHKAIPIDVPDKEGKGITTVYKQIPRKEWHEWQHDGDKWNYIQTHEGSPDRRPEFLSTPKASQELKDRTARDIANRKLEEATRPAEKPSPKVMVPKTVPQDRETIASYKARAAREAADMEETHSPRAQIEDQETQDRIAAIAQKNSEQDRYQKFLEQKREARRAARKAAEKDGK